MEKKSEKVLEARKAICPIIFVKPLNSTTAGAKRIGCCVWRD